MGADYSMCLGYERNKQAKTMPYGSCSGSKAQQISAGEVNWPHCQSISAAVPGGRTLLSMEETYMIEKQESLNLHHIPCTKLK